MTIYDFPTELIPAISSATWGWITNETTYFSGQTQTGQTAKRLGEPLTFSCTINASTPKKRGQIIGFLGRLNGTQHRARIGAIGNPLRGNPAGAPLVLGADQKGQFINTDGWTPSISELLLEKDVISIDGQLRRIVDVISSDAGGLATLHVVPALTKAPADNGVIETANPTGIFICLTKGNEIENIQPAGRAEPITLSFIEDLTVNS